MRSQKVVVWAEVCDVVMCGYFTIVCVIIGLPRCARSDSPAEWTYNALSADGSLRVGYVALNGLWVLLVWQCGRAIRVSRSLVVASQPMGRCQGSSLLATGSGCLVCSEHTAAAPL